MTTLALLNSESLPTYGLPRAPGEDNTTLLLITLTDLSFSEEAHLQSALQTAIRNRDGSGPAASIQIWRPPKSAFLQPLADQNRYILRSYYKDSKANIYGFAVLARRMGWKNFFVADELTKRQLRGESLEDEDERLTVVLVMFRPMPSKPQSTASQGVTQLQEHIRVIAKRQMLAWDDVRANTGLLQVLDTFQLSYECLDQPSLCINDHIEDYGLELTDPGRAAFTPSDISITGREELETLVRKALLQMTPLPLEIVDQVVGLLHDTGGRAFNNPTYSSYYKIYILLLSPLAEDIRVRLESHIQAEVDRQVDKCYESDEINTHIEPGLDVEANQEEEGLCDDSEVLEYSYVHLIPWFYNHTATRLDLERLVKQFHKPSPRRCGVHFLLPTVYGEPQSLSLKDYCIGSVYHGSG